MILADDRDQVVATGSHGAEASGQVVAPVQPALVLYNDAGFGADRAGVAGLLILEKAGVAGATVAALSAKIGDGRSTLTRGVLSAVNEAAYRLGGRWAARPLRWRASWPKKPGEQRRGENQGMAVVNVKSEIAGNVWKIQTKPGDRIEAEGEIMILESMKMEIPVLSPKAGVIKEIKVSEGEAIGEGQLVAILDA